MALTEASKEGIWLRRLFTEITHSTASSKHVAALIHCTDLPVTPQTILVDNNGAVELAKNPKHHDGTKHIDIKHRFVREAVDTRLVQL